MLPCPFSIFLEFMLQQRPWWPPNVLRGRFWPYICTQWPMFPWPSDLQKSYSTSFPMISLPILLRHSNTPDRLQWFRKKWLWLRLLGKESTPGDSDSRNLCNPSHTALCLFPVAFLRSIDPIFQANLTTASEHCICEVECTFVVSLCSRSRSRPGGSFKAQIAPLDLAPELRQLTSFYWCRSTRLQWHRLQWHSKKLPSYSDTFLSPRLDLHTINIFGYRDTIRSSALTVTL